MNSTQSSSGRVPQPPQCDLVMKGGITSGIVYPPLFDVLHKKGFRFRNVGGTSAGAIAAAVTAAAQKGSERGFEKLRDVTCWLGEDKNLLNLFQPTGGTAPLFNTFLAYSRLTLFKLVPLRALVALLSGDALVFAGGAALGALLAFLFAWGIRGDLSELRFGFYVSLALWLLVGAVGVCAAHMYLILSRRIPANFFGICTGRREDADEFGGDVLTDWLHVHLNDLAGVVEAPAGAEPTDAQLWEAPPLTFGQLWKFSADETEEEKARRKKEKDERNIDLKMVTSNLSQNQPYVLPFEKSTFIFNEADFRKLFPPSVVKHLKEYAPEPKGFGLPKGFHFLPVAEQLPVIVATRMSLSFPVLLSMVPLYTIGRDAFPVEMRFELKPPEGASGGNPSVVCMEKIITRARTQPVPAVAGGRDAERAPTEERISEKQAHNLLRAQAMLAERVALKEQHAELRSEEEAKANEEKIRELWEGALKLLEEVEAERETGAAPRKADEIAEAARLTADQLTEAAWQESEARDRREEARSLVSEAMTQSAAGQEDEAAALLTRARELMGQARGEAGAKTQTQTLALRVEWGPAADARTVEVERLQTNWFSDGGICSNFPIHFFDAWLPKRPTFGVNLTSQLEKPGDAAAGGAAAGDEERDVRAVRRRSAYVVREPAGFGDRQLDAYDQAVYLPKPDSVLAPEWIPIGGLGEFLTSIFTTAQNYRDNMQALLPSYRERIVQVRLSDTEGGLNLDMPPEVIEAVMRKGEDAGLLLTTEFDFDQHQWVRFRVLMKKMEESLVKMDRAVREHEIYYNIAQDVFDPSTFPFDPSDRQWLSKVSARLKAVGAVVGAFDPEDLFNKDPQPTPEPQLRVAPEI